MTGNRVMPILLFAMATGAACTDETPSAPDADTISVTIRLESSTDTDRAVALAIRPKGDGTPLVSTDVLPSSESTFVLPATGTYQVSVGGNQTVFSEEPTQECFYEMIIEHIEIQDGDVLEFDALERCA